MSLGAVLIAIGLAALAMVSHWLAYLAVWAFLGIAMEHVAQLYFVDRHQEAIEALRRRDENAVAVAIDADIREGIGGFERKAIENLLRLAGQKTAT